MCIDRSNDAGVLQKPSLAQHSLQHHQSVQLCLVELPMPPSLLRTHDQLRICLERLHQLTKGPPASRHSSTIWHTRSSTASPWHLPSLICNALVHRSTCNPLQLLLNMQQQQLGIIWQRCACCFTHIFLLLLLCIWAHPRPYQSQQPLTNPNCILDRRL